VPDRLLSLRYLLFPLIVLGGLYAYLPNLPLFAPPWEALLPSLPYLLGVLIALLAWHFNSARSLLACGLVLLTDLCLQQPLDPLYRQALLMLLPLNMAQIAWHKERGLQGSSALLGPIWIGLQLIAVTALILHYPQLLHRLLQLRLEQLPPLPFPLSALVVITLATIAIFIRLIFQQDKVAALLLVSMTTCCGLIANPLSERETTLLIAALLVLWLAGLFRHSHRLAYLDDLTGLPGRRALNEHLARLGKKHCLAMLDIDHFKQFNDKHGHDAGDQVLKLVASKIGNVRLGKAYRYGGEEFCVVFAGLELGETLQPLEELRATIASLSVQLRSTRRPKNNVQGKKQRGVKKGGNLSVSVTISIGVAEHHPKSDTLKSADKALYRAKAAGRNRVCH